MLIAILASWKRASLTLFDPITLTRAPTQEVVSSVFWDSSSLKLDSFSNSVMFVHNL